jgi:hypothetical protein
MFHQGNAHRQTSDISRMGSFAFWQMTGTFWVGVMLRWETPAVVTRKWRRSTLRRSAFAARVGSARTSGNYGRKRRKFHELDKPQ